MSNGKIHILLLDFTLQIRTQVLELYQ